MWENCVRRVEKESVLSKERSDTARTRIGGDTRKKYQESELKIEKYISKICFTYPTGDAHAS